MDQAFANHICWTAGSVCRVYESNYIIGHPNGIQGSMMRHCVLADPSAGAHNEVGRVRALGPKRQRKVALPPDGGHVGVA